MTCGSSSSGIDGMVIVVDLLIDQIHSRRWAEPDLLLPEYRRAIKWRGTNDSSTGRASMVKCKM